MGATSRSARSLLQSLSTDQIGELLARIPGLDQSWGHLAKTKPERLQGNSPNARNAVRTSITRNAPDAARALATAAFRFVCWQRALDEDDPANAEVVCAAVHGLVGDDLYKVILACMAEQQGPVVDVIAARFDEFLDLSPLESAADAQPDDDHEALDDTGQPAAMLPIPARDPADLAASLQELLSTAPSLLERVGAAAAALNGGYPFAPLGQDLDAWSSAVRALLAEAGALGTAENLAAAKGLVDAKLAEADVAARERSEIQKAIHALLDAGLPSQAEILAQSHGFASVADFLDAGTPGPGPTLPDAGTVLVDDERDKNPPAFEPKLAIEPEVQAEAPDEPEAHVEAGVVPSPADTIAIVHEPALTDEAESADRALAEVGTGQRFDEPDVQVAAGDDGLRSEEGGGAEADGVGDLRPNESAVDGAEASAALAVEPQSAYPAREPGTGSAEVEDSLPDFPWDEGTPPLLASLIEHGRDVEAILVAEACAETPARRKLLRFYAATTKTSAPELGMRVIELMPTESDLAAFGTDEYRLFAAAALRVSGRLGFFPGQLAHIIERANLGGSPYGALVSELAQAAQRGVVVEDANLPTVNAAEVAEHWASIGVRARELHAALSHRAIKFARATNVLRFLARRGEALDAALSCIQALADGGVDAGGNSEQWAEIETAVRTLCDVDERDRLIEDTDQKVSKRTQLMDPIEAGARQKLHERIAEVGDLAAEFAGLRNSLRTSNTDDQESAQMIIRARAAVADMGEPNSVGEAALHKLADWVRGEEPVAAGGSLEDCVAACLVPLFEVPRSANGAVSRAPSAVEVATLLRGRDTEEVVAGYLAVGNMTAARVARAAAGASDSPEVEEEFQRWTKRHRQEHQETVDSVERAAARLRALYKDDVARSLQARAEALANPDESRFDLSLAPLAELHREAEQFLSEERARLRDEATAVECAPEDRARILALVGEDETLATEFLTMARHGEELPPEPEEHGADFVEFFPAVVDAASCAADEPGRDPIAAVRLLLGHTGEPTHARLRAGVEGWQRIASQKRADASHFKSAVESVLRMIGLEPHPGSWLQPHGSHPPSGSATFRVRATPNGVGYVPAMGTQAAGSYLVTVVWESMSPKQFLGRVDEAGTSQANLFLYMGCLSVKQRRELRSLTQPARRGAYSPLVIDDAVIGWLSTRDEPRWKYTQRVTLPFSTFNPYTPYAGGEVPDEVFVGRNAQSRAIQDPTGSMFVYGGRQLGKSALLRRVERLHTQNKPDADGNVRSGIVALYVDLKAAGVGDSRKPEALWPELAQRLKLANVLPKIGSAAKADAVTAQLQTWLDADAANRLILLLDESDNFLTADAAQGFPVFQGLKGLMESSGRRFKPVFAGLHQVQRLHDAPNTPVAHGGTDILIGPLNPVDAYDLVESPITALGYEFESPDLVWRLLLFTNYQASLVQIVCNELVTDLQPRHLPATGRIVITRADVERVCNDRKVRAQIAERFGLTLNLDSRYRVIALVVALRNLDAPAGATFGVEDLQADCQEWWEPGFGGDVLTRREFMRYLDEMVGLGVLYRRDDEYGLRSPNIVSMLGTRETLETELAEATSHKEVSSEYNPAMNRQILGQATDPWAKRSPLPDQDLGDLLRYDKDAPDEESVRVVAGSRALGVADVAAVIESAAASQEIPVRRIAPDEVDALTAERLPARIHVVVDLSAQSISPQSLTDIYYKLMRRRNLTATLVLGPQHLPLNPRLATALTDRRITTLRRWSTEGLRTWHDSPANTPELRERLYSFTSGWPTLLEETMRRANSAAGLSGAQREVHDQLADADFAREFLDATGAPTDAVEKWLVLADRREDGRFDVLPADLSYVAEVLRVEDPREMLERLQQLDIVVETEDGWVLDAVVAAAAAAVAAA